MLLNKEKILQAYKRLGYTILSKPYQTNIGGVRSNSNSSNSFDDIVFLFYSDLKETYFFAYQATTDPGSYYRLNPINPNGTAIIVPKQHIGVYKVGLHKGYTAMEQIKPMEYYRDNNKDNVLDMNIKTYTEIGKTNIHHASPTGKSELVNNWSAGCQVIADIKDFDEFMKTIITNSKISHQDRFDYTLFKESEIL